MERNCIVCNKSYTTNINHKRKSICQTCFQSLNGSGNFVVKCSVCNKFVKSSHNGNIVKILCEDCRKCKICGMDHSKINKYYSQLCSPAKKVQIFNQYNKSGLVHNNLILRENIQNIDTNNFDSYAKMKWSSSRKLPEKQCKICGRNFPRTNVGRNYCFNCQEIHICQNCGNKFCTEIGVKNRSTIYCSKFCNVSSQHKQGNLKSGNITNVKINNLATLLNIEINTAILFNSSLNINDNNYMQYQFPGIWYKSVNNKIIDVMLTINISREYQLIKKEMIAPVTLKYRKIISKYNINNIKFFLYRKINKNTWNEVLENGLIEELLLGINTEFWQPSPGKQIKLYNLLNNI